MEHVQKARAIAQRLLDEGADHVLFVGGFVRDHLQNTDNKDVDIEVYGLNFAQIALAIGQSFGRVDLVGQQFGVIKVGNEIDVSIPRRENKSGLGHKEFDIEADPTMTPKEAASRRDFTINSMAMDLKGDIFDPFDGQRDLKNKVLRATSPAFAEDPLRVLRGMQFAARFDLTMDAETATMCAEMRHEFDTLSKERIWTEWQKWAKGPHPLMGLKLLRETKWIRKFPDLASMVGMPQDPEWHPEGDAWVHTKLVCDAAAEIADREELGDQDREILMFGALCHDLGKVYTTKQNEEGRWISPGHAEAGVEISKNFLNDIMAPAYLLDQVPPLVAEHMVHLGFIGKEPTHRVIRRLANRLAPTNFKMWSHVVEADHSGRHPLPKGNPVTRWVELAAELDVETEKPKSLLMGRHLIERGVTPGPEMGKTLKAAFEAQLDGEFDTLDGALEWLDAR